MNKRLLLLIPSILCCAGFLFYWMPCQLALGGIFCDLHVYQVAVDNLLHHQTPYEKAIVYGPYRLPSWYLYPPQLVTLFLCFRKLGLNILVHKIWLPLLVSSLFVFAFVCSYIARGNTRTAIIELPVWVTVLLATPGTIYIISIGNVDMILFALLGIAFVCPRFAPAIYAIVGQVKPFALIALVLLWIRERRGFAQAGIVLFIGCLLGASICGLGSFIEWKRIAGMVLTQGTFEPINVSLSFAILRVLHGLHIWHYTTGPLPDGPRLYLQLAAIIGLAVTIYLCRKMPNYNLYAVAILSVMIWSPICWVNYLVFAYILIALYLRDWLPVIETKYSTVTKVPSLNDGYPIQEKQPVS